MSTPSTDNLSTSSNFWPRAKITALGRLKSLGETLVPKRTPAIVFPPPSWELDDETLATAAARSSPALNESNYEDPTPAVVPEPISFAQQLRSLIDALPKDEGKGTSAGPCTAEDAVEESEDVEEAAPVPPGLDEGLVRMLSSEAVMNGQSDSGAKGTERPSIWNVLSGLRNRSKNAREDASSSPVEEDEHGIMMYAPLEPRSDSKVQLGAETQGEKPLGWIPSTVQLSILTTWWGYRIYLPPPVMEKLNAGSLKATARAAMITAALKWVLDKIPMMLVPVQFRPAVTMLKKLGPMLGYVGVFISWSWERIQKLDKGKGVVLTATWILPVALVPMSWD